MLHKLFSNCLLYVGVAAITEPHFLKELLNANLHEILGLFTYDVSQTWRGLDPLSPPCQPRSDTSLPTLPPLS